MFSFPIIYFLIHCLFATKSEGHAQPVTEQSNHLPDIEFNVDYLCNPANRDEIFDNINKRKRHGDIDKVLQLSQQPHRSKDLFDELSKIPNRTDPDVLQYGENPKVLREHGIRPTFKFRPKTAEQLTNKLHILRNENLGATAGQRAYTFVGDLADLEQALVNYSVDKLLKHNFKLISVPDILPTEVIQRCGLLMDNERTLVYELQNSCGQHLCLSGTAEMALAYMLMNKVLSERELPLKLAAVSRCYRAEISRLSRERGLYRVHQFTKVEMFACCDQENSYTFFDELVSIQENMLNELELWFKVLDMPPHELGSPAYRKIDIEGWMPGKQRFGELTSCSNCTDYQSRRLNIKYERSDGKLLHVHTLNGTACAIPRSIIAIVEKYQNENGHIVIPEVLVPYMKGQTEMMGKGAPKCELHRYNPRNEF